jgi:hypothetical protein
LKDHLVTVSVIAAAAAATTTAAVATATVIAVVGTIADLDIDFAKGLPVTS